MASLYVDRLTLQHRLFAELSAMFGAEVPLYDKSLAVNLVCNRAVCRLVGQRFAGFAMSDEQIEATSAERHGAIRIGRPDEYRWIGRFFACFAMEPHSFYDMTALGPKSQPVIATAFRSLAHSATVGSSRARSRAGSCSRYTVTSTSTVTTSAKQ